MEENIVTVKNQKTVKTFTWIILIASGLVFVAAMFGMFTSSFLNSIMASTKIASSVHLNATAILILDFWRMLISGYIILSAVFVLQYREVWRRQIIAGLILAILYMIISPIVTYYSFPQINFAGSDSMQAGIMDAAKTAGMLFQYFWAVAWSVFFIVAIFKYNNKEIKELFS